jgi:hypothetical protein
MQKTDNKEQVVCCLKSLFGSCDVKIVVQNMLRETKRLFSPELRGIMGEEYPHFQNLDKKSSGTGIIYFVKLFKTMQKIICVYIVHVLYM